jgi:GNAT superfamily N-acetyltransferase
VSDWYAIAHARPGDLTALAAIERAASTLLEGHAPPSVLAETTSDAELAHAHAEGLLWVALVDEAPVGFALVEILDDGVPHLEEIDVHPRFGRRGIGAALVATVCDWAARAGHAELTLTTFRSLPWNMSFYGTLGFQEIAAHELRPSLAARLGEEAARGLDPSRRVAMRRRF